MDIILSTYSTCITKFKKNPSKVIVETERSPVAILNHNKPVAYLLSAAPESIMERLRMLN